VARRSSPFLRRPWLTPRSTCGVTRSLPQFAAACPASTSRRAACPLEESEAAILGVGPFAAQPLTAERRAARPVVEIRYGCDSATSLSRARRRRLARCPESGGYADCPSGLPRPARAPRGARRGGLRVPWGPPPVALAAIGCSTPPVPPPARRGRSRRPPPLEGGCHAATSPGHDLC
jgi:hypothetical protein